MKATKKQVTAFIIAIVSIGTPLIVRLLSFLVGVDIEMGIMYPMYMIGYPIIIILIGLNISTDLKKQILAIIIFGSLICLVQWVLSGFTYLSVLPGSIYIVWGLFVIALYRWKES